jgi:hypothetical protein
MRSWGIWLVILGVGAFVLPYFGLQFKILSMFGEALPMVAGGIAVVGAVLLGLSFRAGSQASQAHPTK